MAEFKIDGRMKVKKLKEDFFNEYGGVLRVYNGKERADDDASLASIRANDAARGGELVCRGNRSVGNFKKEMWDVFGIKVQVATKDDWIIVLDSITLSKIKDIPNYASKESMQAFVNGVTQKAKKIGTAVLSTISEMRSGNKEKEELSIEQLLEELQSTKYELEEKCNEVNQQLVEALRQYTEATGNKTFSMAMDEEKVKEYLMNEQGYDEEDIEDPCDCGGVNYSDNTEYYYPQIEALMNFYITSLLDDCYFPVEYKYARCLAEFAIDDRFDDKIAVKRYFDDDGTEHESECEGFLLANPNIPETYMQVKALIDLVEQYSHKEMNTGSIQKEENQYADILAQLEGKSLVYIPTYEYADDGCSLDQPNSEYPSDTWEQMDAARSDFENGETSCGQECKKVDLSKDGVYYDPKTYNSVAVLGGKIVSALCNEGETLRIGDQEFDVNEL